MQGYGHSQSRSRRIKHENLRQLYIRPRIMANESNSTASKLWTHEHVCTPSIARGTYNSLVIAAQSMTDFRNWTIFDFPIVVFASACMGAIVAVICGDSEPCRANDRDYFYGKRRCGYRPHVGCAAAGLATRHACPVIRTMFARSHAKMCTFSAYATDTSKFWSLTFCDRKVCVLCIHKSPTLSTRCCDAIMALLYQSVIGFVNNFNWKPYVYTG